MLCAGDEAGATALIAAAGIPQWVSTETSGEIRRKTIAFTLFARPPLDDRLSGAFPTCRWLMESALQR